jgi:radical SAM superfamily enzyme YgiQ (UPF0313 family)
LRVAKLTLVSIHLEPSPRAVPLAAGLLSAVLREAHPGRIETCLVDGFLQQSEGELVAAILAEEPDWVGFSMYVWNRHRMQAVARRLKRQRPELILFAGGPEPTAAPDGLVAPDGFDFILPGEGERVIAEALGILLEGGSPATIAGRITPGPIPDLSVLPSPYLDGSLPPEQLPGIVWELSRGCPFRCDFCYESRGSRGVRRFPRQRLEAELRRFVSAGIEEIFVLDPTFNFEPEQAKELLRLFRDLAPGIRFSIEIRAEYVDRDMAELFAAVHCSLQIGLQSADPAVLANIHRSFNREDFENRLLLLHEAGVSYGLDLIYGLPGDTLGGFLDSLDFALALLPNHLDIFPLAVLPGTRLAETAAGFGLEYEPQQPYRLLASSTFSAADLAEADRLARACDLFYNRGRAVPWFGLVLENLAVAPSVLLRRLADWLDAAGAWADTDLTALQQRFVSDRFLAEERPAVAAVAADVIAYFGHSAALLSGDCGLDGEPPAPSGLRLHPDSRWVDFNHDPSLLLENLEIGVTDFQILTCLLPPEPCRALLYLCRGEVSLGVFADEERELLEAIAEGRCQGAPTGPLGEFFEAAVAEGIIDDNYSASWSRGSRRPPRGPHEPIPGA